MRLVNFFVINGFAVVVATAQVTADFRGLGSYLPGLRSSFAYGVSGDGSVVVGALYLPSGERRAFRWVGNTVEILPADAVAYAASQNGSVVVGQAFWTDTQTLGAFRWTVFSGMERLPIYDALGVSADGNVIVGAGLRWIAPGILESIGHLGGNYTSAQAVSADGNVVVGYSQTTIPGPFGPQTHAFRWTPSSGMQDLGSLPRGSDSAAHGVSPDGSVVVGQARNRDFWWRAFRWTPSTRMVELGTLGGPMSAAYDASLNGTVIVGKSLINSSSASERAFRWTTRKKMQDLRRELLDAGVTRVQNWILLSATGVSYDGTVIVGYGLNPNRQYEAWRAVLPIPR